MKHLIFCSTFLLTVPVHAQSWCAPEAVWFHDYPYTAFGDYGYVETRYTGQVLFADSVCEAFSIIEHGWSDQTNTPWEGGPFTMHTHTAEDGLILIWDGSAFDTLFHFGAAPSDHWQFPTEWVESGTHITVTDTGHTMVSNMQLRYLTVEARLEDIVFVADTVFERIGPMELYLNIPISHYFLIDGGYGGLRCYSDADFEVTRVDGPCEIPLGTGSERMVARPILLPNPGTDRLTIAVDTGLAPNSMVQLVDAQGRVIATTTLANTRSGWNIGAVAAGCYVVRVLDGTRLMHALKWMCGPGTPEAR